MRRLLSLPLSGFSWELSSWNLARSCNFTVVFVGFSSDGRRGSKSLPILIVSGQIGSCSLSCRALFDLPLLAPL